MRKKAVLAVLCLLLLFLLCGCWNYRGLNEIDIVSGMAIDMDPASGEFKVVYETVDLSNVKNGGPKPKLVESTGATIFDAARNAKRRLAKKLYFGNDQIVIISEELAKSGHLMHIIDWFLRDAELRETVHVIVSQEKTAAEMLSLKGINNPIVSYEIEKMIMDDNSVTSSTNSTLLYQVFDTLHTEGLSLTLPALHTVMNDKVLTTETNGVAVFKGESMLGYLTPEESKYLLFIINEVKGGVLTMPSKEGEPDNISLEISQNSTKQSFTVENGKLIFSINTETRVYLDEIGIETDALDKETITSLEAAAGAKLKNEMQSVIRKVQTEYRSDVFGFGNTIRKKNNKLWKSISGYWDELFSTLQVNVNAKVTIANTAYIKNTKQEGGK
jgi:spore germination protein KC